jgi:hypothetical protein
MKITVMCSSVARSPQNQDHWEYHLVPHGRSTEVFLTTLGVQLRAGRSDLMAPGKIYTLTIDDAAFEQPA